MKKRMLSILLTVCMVLSLLPATALADGNDTGMAMATNYAELVSALQDSTVKELTIYPQWPINIENNEYSYFTWPEGETTLNLDAVNSVCKIYLANGTWTIPENVTVNAYDTVLIGAPTGTGMVINGTWNCMSNQAIIGNVSGGGALYGALTVNGTLAIAQDLRVSPAQVGSFTLNGILKNAGVCYINHMTMAAGAKVVNVPDPEIINSMREIYLVDGGSITGPSTGSASIGGEIAVPGTGALSGNLTADQITLSYGSTLTVADGADVTIDKLTCNGTSSPAAINVNGKLTVTTDGYNTVSHTTITLGEYGILALSPNVQFGSSSSNSTITGEGTLELYGILREWDGDDIACEYCSRIFGTDSDKTDGNGGYAPLTGVNEDTLTVKRMWEICTGHSWGETTTVDPTCSERGYDTATCSECGTEKRSNYVVPTGNHTITYTQNGTSAATATCSVCGWTGRVSISVPQSSYVATGEAITPAVLSKMGSLEESIPDADITYTNNVEPGTATASATFGDVTISTTFNIVACDHVEGTAATCTSGPICSECGLEYGEPLGHTGGTATCKEQATCTRPGCGEKYGDLAPHTWGSLQSDADGHWYACSVCGTQASEEETKAMLGATWELETAKYNEEHGTLPTAYQHLCSEVTDCETASVCAVCGYTVREAGSHIWNDGKVTTTPTCTEKGVKTYTCTSCSETRTENIPALGHDRSYAASGAVITETCSRGDHTATATLTAEDASYTGEAIETASVAYGDGWQGGGLTIACTNNVNAGTANASITLGGQTASATFTISRAAAHTLTLGNLSQTSGSVSAVTWTVSPKDDTAQVKVEYEITVPASPCTHVHDASCGENGTACTHAHDDSCGYAEESKVWTGTLPTEAGTYPVRARLTASENLELADAGVYATGTLTIVQQSSGGGGSVTVIPDEPEITTGGGTTVAGVVTEVTTSGTTSNAVVSQDALDKAIQAAESAAGKAGTNAAVEIVVNTPAKATAVKVDLPAEGLENFAGSEAQSLTISSGVGTVTVSPEAADSIAGQAQGDTVTVTIRAVTQPEKTLNERQLAAVGDAPVYNLSVTSNGKYITDFDGGLITVSLPYTLKAGEDPNGVVVYYVDDLGNIQRVRAMYDVQTQSIIFTTNHFSFYMVRYESAAAAAARFTDVSFDAYYQSAVGWAASHGVTSGVTETIFAPDDACTRAQAVTFLWRAAGSPAPKSSVNPFADVKADAYYYDAVLWAVENGITSGTSETTFSPDTTCTRAQIVTFLWRAQKAPAAEGVHPFTDVAADVYYADAVLWAAENSITGGTSATTFSPNHDCTRAQIVTFLWRCMGE